MEDFPLTDFGAQTYHTPSSLGFPSQPTREYEHEQGSTTKWLHMQVTEALARAGLESANLIVGIDFTKGNEWTGKFSVHYRSMHHISDIPNLYEHAISIIGQTLSSFEKDNLIFGDASTHDQDVFSFFPDERPRTGLEALSRYKEIFKHSILAGPASFAPSIKKALTVVEQSGGQYHVLLIIADGQITQSLVTQSGYLSSLDQETVDAIVNSSEFPLSIVLVGVGDGPWDMIKKFDHNFQFVNFTEIMSKETHQKRKETEFALAALREIPSQYKATIELGILGKSARSPQRVALPPPDGSRAAAAFGSKSFQSTSFQKSSPSYTAYDSPTSYDPSAPSVSWEQVTEALARAGLESSNLIVGVDFTKSNEWTGKFSFHNRSLHHISDTPNPYEYAISIIGQTLSAFDEDNLIPCYGFGDASTHDQDVFSFFPDERPCTGFSEALSRYREIVPHLRLAGPTSFAPMIEKAMTIVEQSGGQYHVLLIIADGQVTRSVDTPGYLSLQQQKTVDAIVKASEFPLSIVLVGVGDGPWDVMKEFDDNIPARSFDNFQFVNFTEIMSKNTHQKRKETEFALAALMEIPSQYKATIELGILGKSARSPRRVALPPPDGSRQSTSLQKSSSPYTAYDSPTSYYPSAPSVSWEQVCCPVCLTERKNLAFGCGHQTCYGCGQDLVTCPICRSEIVIRIRLY